MSLTHRPTFLPACLLLTTLLGATVPALAAGEASSRQLAVETYDAGRYDEARKLIEALDARGEADGPLLYRLYYCLRQAGDPGARAMQERARVALEKEVLAKPTLESGFYLANVYENQARLTDRQQLATRITKLVADGKIPPPESGIDQFRLGKLYADRDDDEHATEWFARSLDSLTADDTTSSSAYVPWAARYLADRAMARDDLAQAEKYRTLLLRDGQGTVEDYDELAMLRVRAQRYAEAVEAWKKAERLAPATGDRARYCAKLAGMAAELTALPEQAPDGRPWKELSKEDLERTMQEQATIVREATTEAKAEEPPTKERRAELQTRIHGVKPLFVAAGLEYALRGYSIREAAFFGGYAPLIFRATEWQIPPGPRKRPVRGGRPGRRSSGS